MPTRATDMPKSQIMAWRFFAGLTIGFAIWYIWWRWTMSLNPDAFWYSALIAGAETAAVFGLVLFYYDIWEEPPRRPVNVPDPAKAGGGSVDIFIATYDEDLAIVRDSVADAMAVRAPDGWSVAVHVLDDGNRPAFRTMAETHGARYHCREDNLGFKAGNLKNALLRTDGDFVVIGDADTRFLPGLLEQTLGYFHDRTVAWVQTPHWFYDIPVGQKLSRWIPIRFGRDPFLADPTIFFDVIQRRRDRHGASFCCGAGSIHRRTAICEHALRDFSGRVLQGGRHAPVQPFRFHVSEDLYTSIQLHQGGRGWTSVYHPDPVSRMLSPWSLDAWAAQKLKYAGGTFDIFLNHAAPWTGRMPTKIWLHYMATFWSYLSVFPMLILFFAPIVTLTTAVIPISSYSLTFFVHLMPMLICAEIALNYGCKGHDVHGARILSVATAPYILRAFFQALTRQKIGFRPTPKTLKVGPEFRFVRWQIGMLVVSGAALAFGTYQFLMGQEGYSGAMMIVNGFWVLWNMTTLMRVIRLAHWKPQKALLPQGDLWPQEQH